MVVLGSALFATPLVCNENKEIKMKASIAFLTLFLTTSIFAQSPIQKGTINLNGNISFSSQSYGDMDDGRNLLLLNSDDREVLLLNPQVGYFFIDNISLSLSLDYSRYSQGGVTNTNWAIGPSIRYYFDLEEIIPFLSISYSYTEEFNSYDYKVIGSQFGITGGSDLFITRNVALETTISYLFNNDRLPESLDQKSNTILIGIGINIFIY
jgi:hypothetical protein